MIPRRTAALAIWLVALGLPVGAIWLLPTPADLGHWTLWVALFFLIIAITYGVTKMIETMTDGNSDQ